MPGVAQRGRLAGSRTTQLLAAGLAARGGRTPARRACPAPADIDGEVVN